MSDKQPRSVLREFRDRRGDFLRIWGPGILVAVVGFGVAWFFVEPAPPDRVAILAGPKDGVYYRFAQQYAQVFKENGVTLEVVATEGSVENLRRLQSQEGKAQVAIVQGGTAPPRGERKKNLVALASLYYEPVWVFYVADEELTDPRDLAGRRVAVGREGSGTRAISMTLLEENGLPVDPAGDDPPASADRVAIVEVGGEEAADALLGRRVDAAFFVVAAESAVIRRLLASEDVRLMNMVRHEAYARRLSYVSSVVLVRGAIDPARDLPSSDVQMIAPAAALVATDDLHEALIPLLLKAATLSHERGDLFAEPGTFPATQHLELPLSEESRRWFREGPSFLQKYLPFWVASFLDRMKILLLPALTLLFPLFRIAPPLFQWRVRKRIFRWYGVVQEVDESLRREDHEPDLERHQKTLAQLEKELDDVSVPLSYMAELYNLRLHIALIRRSIEKRLAGEDGSGANPTAEGADVLDAFAPARRGDGDSGK
ncbi:MAG: TAXI family TRAP transporter solute-binding subunit [Planctomycetes bacterium]|nr:TAXI family TRAP transporter solute-binding subunit [Planctomycetota bacterium]